jgi:chlorobactene glucosyltransferase
MEPSKTARRYLSGGAGRGPRVKGCHQVLLLSLSCAWLAVVVWLGLRAWRQRSALPLLRSRRANGERPRIAVIVPARNEARNIGACLKSLIDQTIAGSNLHIIVIDDASSDGTAAIATECAAAAGSAEVSVIRTSHLPPGWRGKVHACWLGYLAAPKDADWLCFLDADMRARPSLLESALVSADQQGLDLLSLAPRHELGSFAERLIIPCGHYLLAFSQELSRIQSPQSGEVAVTGQFMLFRRAAYEHIGGHASVPLAICEDLEIALLAKGAGHRVLMQDGSRLLTARMYTGWKNLWPGFAKNLIEMAGGVVPTIVYAVAAVVLSGAALALPALDAASCVHGSSIACWALLPAALASAAALAFHLFGAAHFGIPLIYGLLFPVGYWAGALLALDSLRWRLTGRVRWKGRVYS